MLGGAVQRSSGASCGLAGRWWPQPQAFPQADIWIAEAGCLAARPHPWEGAAGGNPKGRWKQGLIPDLRNQSQHIPLLTCAVEEEVPACLLNYCPKLALVSGFLKSTLCLMPIQNKKQKAEQNKTKQNLKQESKWEDLASVSFNSKLERF